MKLSRKQTIYFIVGIVLGIAFFLIPAFEGMSEEGMHVLGIFAMAVSWWIGGVFEEYITAFWMMSLMVATGSSSLSTVFSAFSGSVVWIVIPVLAIGTALSKSGLLLRCVLGILSKFKGGYKSRIVGVLLAGNIINPLIPSATAKVAIAAPIIRMYGETLGYTRESKETAGLFAAMWMGFGANGPFFITGTAMCFAMIGVLPAEYQDGFTFMRWLELAFPWGLVLALFSYISICIFYAPKNEQPVSMEFIEQKRKELGKMSAGERVAAAVLVVCIVLWITENLHGVSSTVVALAGMTVLLCANVIDKNDFKARVPWDTVIFIGSCCGLGTVFSKAGITAWVGTFFGPYIEPLFGNIYLLIIVLVTIVALIRIVFVSQTAVITVLTVAATPFALAVGMHPVVPGLIVLVTVNIVNASYNNSIFMTAMAASGNLVEFSKLQKMSFVYYFACIAGLMCCIPFWKLMGLM